jgi:hypothetical protein
MRAADLAVAAGLVLLGLAGLGGLAALAIGTYVVGKRVGRDEKYNDDVAEHLRRDSRRYRRP